MASISKFLSVTKASFARPNLYTIEIGGSAGLSPENKIMFNCNTVMIPQRALNYEDGPWISQPHTRLGGEVAMTFQVSEDFAELEYFDNWFRQVGWIENGHFAYHNDCVRDIIIRNYSRDNKLILTTKIIDAYPKTIDPIQLDYGTTDTIMTVNVTMTYRHFTANFPMAKVKDGNAALPNTYAKSSNTAMNKIDPMWEIENEGWKFGQNYQGSDASNFDVGPDED